jgi:hypothetical protein
MIFDKKNRFIAWTGNPADKPILKNLDGMSGRYPKWINENVAKIASRIITSEDHPAVESLIDEAFYELKSGKVRHEDLASSRRFWCLNIPTRKTSTISPMASAIR